MQATAARDDPQDDALIHTLGYAGLIPPVLLAALVWLVAPDLQAWVAMSMAAYVGLIASFLGGIHWGIAWSQRSSTARTPAAHAWRAHVLWGVAPSLLAWPGLLMPPYAGLVWLGLVLLACYGVDRRLYPHAGLQHWLTLRFRLSCGISLSCFIAAGAL